MSLLNEDEVEGWDRGQAWLTALREAKEGHREEPKRQPVLLSPEYGSIGALLEDDLSLMRRWQIADLVREAQIFLNEGDLPAIRRMLLQIEEALGVDMSRSMR